MFYSRSTGGFYTPDVNGTNIPNDAVQITNDKHQELMNGQSEGMVITPDENGNPVLVERVLSDEELIASYTGAVQLHLDNFAKGRGYDGIMSATTYVSSNVVRFANDASAAMLARDNTWQTCYQILADVSSGARPAPTVDELIDELPELVWGD